MHRSNWPAALIVISSLAPVIATAEGPPPLSNSEVKTVVESHLDDIKSCLGEHGSANGKLVVSFAILATGKVMDAKPKEHSSNAALDKCIAHKFAGFTFPKPRGGVTMGAIYPFQFAPALPPKEGHLEEAQVVSVAKAKQTDIDACYKEAVKEKVGLQGVVKVAVVISPEGAVTEAKVDESSTGAPKLDACLIDHVKTWQYPKPTGGGEFAVRFPIAFGTPKGDAKK